MNLKEVRLQKRASIEERSKGKRLKTQYRQILEDKKKDLTPAAKQRSEV